MLIFKALSELLCSSGSLSLSDPQLLPCYQFPMHDERRYTVYINMLDKDQHENT
jgi:hypothetical protein